jgi:phosphatidate cytidylyltransferase
VVLALLFVGGWPLALAVAALAALGAREVFQLAGHGGVRPLAGFGAAAAAGLVLFAAWRPAFPAFAALGLGLLGAVAGVALVAALKVRGPAGRPLESVAATLFGAVYCGLSLAFVPLLHALPVRGWSQGGNGAWHGLLVVALPLATTWLGDALAFFGGRAWGHGGLAPSISPKKSWAGVWSGLAGAGFAGVAWYLIARNAMPGLSVPGMAVALAVGVLLGVAAILGDLVESLLKRAAGVKDSGTFFPGHGGILDRLDALVFSLPVAYAILAVLEASA